jgi:DNA-binding response OmpR family regulator
MPRRILVVEDDRDIAGLLQVHLGDLGFEVDIAYDGLAALAKAGSSAYELMILDLMLPGVEGLEVCRRVRSQSRYTPILMLTARSTELDRVLGLEMGADDYLTKPFSVRELLARVKAILRRGEALAGGEAAAPERIEAGELAIDVPRRGVWLKGRELTLTPTEFDLLLHFAKNPGRVYTRTQLLDQVWGYTHAGYEHTVNSHINRLRAKVEEDPAHPHYILTVWGVGYKFAATPGSG